MSSGVRHVTIDSLDPYMLASFWTMVTGGRLHDDDHPGDPAAFVLGGATTLLFVEVPDAKMVKNRVHLDLRPDGVATRDSEVERIVGLGATLVADRREPDGSGWVVLADPEGNEFCIERSQAERDQA